jgi:hypothetical protein
MMGGGSRGRGMGAMGGMTGMPAMTTQNNESMRGGMGRMSGGMMGGGLGGMMGSTETVADVYDKKVMIRAFDFTVQEDMSYRYRVRIVVFNPNKGREDISPGVDNKADELRGPWSQETDQVAMPPDIMPYATGSLPPGQTADMKVRFQVIRFHPLDGVTVLKTFDAAPGEVIGEPRTVAIPVSDGSGKKSKVIDFNSRQIVLDVIANKKSRGDQPLPRGFIGPPIARPVVALTLRPDGSVVVHNEADDESNDVRKDITANYKHELAQSSKERKSNLGAGAMGGMMGRMSGRGGMGGAPGSSGN